MKKSKLRIAFALFMLLVAFAALRAALAGLDWSAFRAQLHQLDWRWLALAVFFDILSYAVQGVRWRLLLHGSTIWQTTRAIYAGLFLNEVIPFRPGEAIRAWLAARDCNVGLWSVVPTMLTERLMDGLWLAAALLAALQIAPLPPTVVRAVHGLASILAFVALAVWWLGGKQSAFLRTVRNGLHNMRALLLSAGVLLGQGLAFWSVLHASHLALGLTAACVVMVVVRIGTMLPGAPANLGTHQFSTVLALSLYNVPQAQAAGFAIVVFTVLTLPLLLLGLAACLSAGLTWRNVRHSIAANA